MPSCKSPPNEVPNNVVQGPWPKRPHPDVKIPDEDWMAIQENLAFADHLTEGLVVQLIHTLGENGVDVSSETFIKDIGFLIESVKSSIHRDMGLKHPMQGIVDALVTTSAPDEEGGKLISEFNMDVVGDLVKDFEEDDIS